MEKQFDKNFLIFEQQFIDNCLSDKCIFRNLKSKQCYTEKKQKRCYEKYVEKRKKQFDKSLEKDWRWEDLKQNIIIRDNNECQCYKILNKEEIKIVEKQEGFWLQRHLDGAHIIPRLSAPNHVYNENNVILLGRFFHSRIDSYLDLISGEFIGLDGAALWWTRIMRANKRWKEDFDYWMFRMKLVGQDK